MERKFHITWMTPSYAEDWTRFVYNVQPHVGLGWKPYTILIQTRGVTAHTAFHNRAELRRWLQVHGYRLELGKSSNQSRSWRGRIRSGYVIGDK